MCTANQCRSPMAEALLRARLAERGVEGVTVHSAGLLPGGEPATDRARQVVPGLEGHLSRRIDPAQVAGADLVVTMAREHVREVTVLAPDAFARTFTLRELVRRAERNGPRRGAPLADWLAGVGVDRSMRAYVGDDPSDDIVDPVGGPLSGYRAVAAEIDDLVTRLVSVAFA